MFLFPFLYFESYDCHVMRHDFLKNSNCLVAISSELHADKAGTENSHDQSRLEEYLNCQEVKQVIDTDTGTKKERAAILVHAMRSAAHANVRFRNS